MPEMLVPTLTPSCPFGSAFAVFAFDVAWCRSPDDDALQAYAGREGPSLRRHASEHEYIFEYRFPEIPALTNWVAANGAKHVRTSLSSDRPSDEK